MKVLVKIELEQEIIDIAEAYIKKHNMTMSELIEKCFTDLFEKEAKSVSEVTNPQISCNKDLK